MPEHFVILRLLCIYEGPGSLPLNQLGHLGPGMCPIQRTCERNHVASFGDHLRQFLALCLQLWLRVEKLFQAVLSSG